jgi:hypothetical protein
MANEVISQVDEVINTMIDEFIIYRKKPKFNMLKFLQGEKVDRRTINQICEDDSTLRNVFIELSDVQDAIRGMDPVLSEAYGHLKKPELREYQEMLQQIVEDVKTYKDTKRITRKRNSPPPEKQVKGIRYNQAQIIGGTIYKSIDPALMVAKRVLCFYNTKMNELTVIYANKNIKVKGTTVIDFDEEKSWTKRIRNPLVVLPRLTGPIRPEGIEQIKNSIKTKHKVPTGRINQHCILLKAM